MNKVIKLKKITLILLCIICLCGCSKKNYENPIVTMEIADYGSIKMELYPKYAQNTVANFVNLIEDGFYDNSTFHRLVKGFVLQGGDPNGDGTGGPGYNIKGEFKENNYSKNTLKHTTGIVSMARSIDYDSAGSQFFIVLDDNDMVSKSLDGKYAAFGKVIEGMDIIDKIASTAKIENEQTGKLEENIKITKVTVDTKGKNYQVKKV